jgi:hypothetical protein
MRTEIEDLVESTLHARADGRTPTPALYERAVRRGRSLRRRRQSFACGGVAVAVAVVVAGVAVAPAVLQFRARPTVGAAPPVQPPPPVQASPTPPRNGGPTTLPPARAWPAGARPSVVGTDPGVVHFDLDLAALHATGSEWNTDDGFESAVVFTGNSDTYHVASYLYLSPDEAVLRGRMWGAKPTGLVNGVPRTPPPAATEPVDVHGRPGTVERFGTAVRAPDGTRQGPHLALRWQPVDGLWAGVDLYGDVSDAMAVADALRLDRTQRCVVPVHATVVPAGARWTGCTTQVSPHAGLQGVWVGSSLLFTRDGNTLVVDLQDRTAYNGVNPGDFKPNARVAGRPAMWDTPKNLVVPGFAGRFYLEIALWHGGYTKAEAVAVAEGLEAADDLARPETWPVPAVG